MITTKNYTINYEKINELSLLGKSLPAKLFNRSKYFKNVKGVFWRVTNLEEKYKILMSEIRDSEMKADDLVSIRERGGIKALEEELRKGKSGFYSTSYGSDGVTIHFVSKKIDTALQDYISKFSELLETLKYLLADIYDDTLNKQDSFNKFIKLNKPQVSRHFDFNYLTDFNKYLWNEQKHQSDISVTAITYTPDGTIMPKMRAEGRFKNQDLKTFIEESLENIIKLFKFIHDNAKMTKQTKNLSKDWLVGFKGENSSLYYNLNFLWNNDSVYIMDNHRAAMWCWLQEIKMNEKYDLFHIDRHSDTLYSNMESWLKIIPDLKRLSLNEYLKLSEKEGKVPVIRYDNYLSIFLEKYSSLLDTCWFSTYLEGDKPKWNNLQTPTPKSLPSSFEYWLEQSPNKWIINLDLDLFFCDNEGDGQIQLHSNIFIKRIGRALKRQKDKGKIAVITIALSPEWSSGWKETKKVCSILTESMGINFQLPKS